MARYNARHLTENRQTPMDRITQVDQQKFLEMFQAIMNIKRRMAGTRNNSLKRKTPKSTNCGRIGLTIERCWADKEKWQA